MKPYFYLDELTDENEDAIALVRENFRELKKFIELEPFLNGEFKHYSLTFDVAVTAIPFQHRLKFVPKDIIQTFLTEGVTITWLYDSFDRETISFTTSGPCTLRFFVGRYQKEIL